MSVVPARPHLYDQIGTGYSATRCTDPRIAARIWAALGDARTVLNVGAGTGSYEPPDRDVTAVEPSALMRSQRPAGAARCLAADAGRHRDDDVVYVDVTMRAGRTDDQKKALYARIAELASKYAAIEPRNVFVVIHENQFAGWSFGEGVAQYLDGGQ